MNPSDLKVGQLYFTVVYEDPDLSRPIVITYEYLGYNLHEDAEGASESGRFWFNYLSPFGAEQDDENAPPQKSPLAEFPHTFSESDLTSMHDIDGLISELAEAAPRMRRP